MRTLASDTVRVKIFAFIHELQKTFAPRPSDKSLGTSLLSRAFFDELDILRSQCNEFTAVRTKLEASIGDAQLKGVVDMVEFLVPGFSLDLLTLIIVAVIQHEGRGLCCQVSRLRVFNLLK